MSRYELHNGTAYAEGDKAYESCPAARYEIDGLNAYLQLAFCNFGEETRLDIISKVKNRPAKPEHSCKYCK